jgi:pimeloyl-ACP methyl ester carboxylesterase
MRIASGGRSLSAVYVQAEETEAGEKAPVFLICHGIGERVEYWGGVQCLLKTMGVSSLVFNYSGYGGSTGRASAAHCEEDAVAAYRELVRRGHRSIFLLGFSLGSGVALAVASRLELEGVILCEGFSSLREAAGRFVLPRWMTWVVPQIWENVSEAGKLEVPVLVVHGDQDRLFPVSMAERVAAACGSRGELMVVCGVSHNAPIFAPTEAYWRPVVEWGLGVAGRDGLPAGPTARGAITS